MEDDTRPQHSAAQRGKDGDAIAEALNGTTSPDAGGTVSGTKPEPASGGFEIVFEAEEESHSRH